MNIQRGDVVLLEFPYTSGGTAKMRPALVVQNDRDNQRLTNTIVVQITSVTRRATEPTQVLVEISTIEGRQTGLRQDSVVNCANVLTLDKDKLLRKLGTFTSTLLDQVDLGLKSALGLG